jgi:hypothetical protein
MKTDLVSDMCSVGHGTVDKVQKLGSPKFIIIVVVVVSLSSY